jgi:hypothetical protein
MYVDGLPRMSGSRQAAVVAAARTLPDPEIVLFEICVSRIKTNEVR